MVRIDPGDAALENAAPPQFGTQYPPQLGTQHLPQLGTQPTRAMSSKLEPPPSSHVSTEAAPPKPKLKRARTSRPKVKTGCNNCKQRRIKCDEARPACSQCIRSKKTCVGYPPPSRSARPNQVLIAPKPILAAAHGSSRTTPDIAIAIAVPSRRLAKYHRRATTPPDTPTSLYDALVPSAPTQQRQLPLYLTPAGLSLNQKEAQYFQLFREHTASDLSGFFDSAFWSRSVLRECHSEKAIRHAVLALGALYRTLDKTAESVPPPPHASGANGGSSGPWSRGLADHLHEHWDMAIKQYSHALNALVAVSSVDRRSHRARLMASVLLACFDSFVGDHKQAIKQIQNGLGFLDRLRADPTGDDPVDPELVHMFTRLAIQAKSYDMAFHFPHPYVVMLSTPPTTTTTAATPPASRPTSASANTDRLEDTASNFFPAPVHPESSLLHQHIPDSFSTVVEARLAWDCLIERVLRFNEIMLTRSQSGVMGIVPEVVARQTKFGLQFRIDFERWAAAFDPILQQRTAPGVSSQEKAGIAVLKMYNTMGYILFTMGFCDSEAQFDRFTPEFRHITELALELVGDEERRAAAARCREACFCKHGKHSQPSFAHSPHPHHGRTTDFGGGARGGHHYETSHIRPSFSADLGIVPPLFVTATKCRDPLIRRLAIQLLRSSSRREAMWDSEMTASIATWILDVEEKGLRIQPQPSRHDSVDLPLSPAQSSSSSSTAASPPADSTATPWIGPLDHGDAALGPGGNGNGRGWAAHNAHAMPVREPVSYPSPQQPMSGAGAVAHSPDSITSDFLVSPSDDLVTVSSIPEAKRVMVRSVDFDLRARFALVQLGSRELPKGSLDMKQRATKITW